MTARDPSKSGAEMALVRGCVLHEAAAWRDMISKYGALVAHAARTTLQRVLKSVDPNQVDEASQAIWAMLVEDDCRRLKSFAAQSALSTWLTVLSTRRTLDYIRTEMRKGALKLVHIETSDNEDLLNEVREAPAAQAPNDDELTMLHEGMDRLPVEDRLILKMYYLDGLSYRTIAKAMKVAPNTVSSYIFRAREKLKAILAKKE
jgi:RNA polymerase sigma-70 factor (ECF subfamily)